MERKEAVRALRRASRKADKACLERDQALLAARDAGVTFDAMAEVTGWDRRTVSRYIAKLALELAEAGYVVTVRGNTLKIETGEHGDA